jgi:hypothetical protein
MLYLFWQQWLFIEEVEKNKKRGYEDAFKVIIVEENQ